MFNRDHHLFKFKDNFVKKYLRNMAAHVKLIFGGGSFMEAAAPEPGYIDEALNILHEAGVKNIDTARIYQDSEELLGKAHAHSRFTIDTKYPGGLAPEPSSKESLVETLEESLKLLQTDQVSEDTRYEIP